MRLTITDLAGERGGETVFSGIGFSLEAGESLVVTGPNGAGKSTLLRVIAGLLPIAAGRLDFKGDAEFPDLASALHYLGHQNAMKTALTVNENLRFWQQFGGEPHLSVQDALETVGLGDIGHLPFAYLSTGQKRRAAIAKLLVNYRPVWLLDEPTAGLDRASEAQFTALMQAHCEDGGIVIAATHLPLGLEGVKTLEMSLPSPLWGGSPEGRGGGSEA
ncbi:MAG: heme ABC exporter ATP-binding protein CcmA [Rhizobiaceae bacterium]